MNRQLVVPFLWYNSGAEDAARFYVSLFPDSGIIDVVRCGPGGPGPEGSALTVEFRLAGVHYVALNGGPHYRLNEAFSLSVPCDTQEEIDRLWTALWTRWAPDCGLRLSCAPCFERYTPEYNPRTGLGGMEIWIPLEGSPA